jgi:hypothetical protein
VIVGLAATVIGWIVAVAFVLHLFSHRLLTNYLEYLVNISIRVVLITAGVLWGLIQITPKFLLGLIKSAATLAVTFVSAAAYLLTFAIPFIGGQTRGFRNQFSTSLSFQYLSFEMREARSMMIGIMANHDDRDLLFESEEQYRRELEGVKQDGKSRLENGETLLSLGLGPAIVAVQFSDTGLLQMQFFGMSVSLLVEVLLLVLAVSIIYRVSILEFLTYSSDTEFESLEEMDAALSYQKGVSLAGLVQGLTVIFVFGFAVTNIREEVLEFVLERKYEDDLGVRSWLTLAWTKVRK